MFPGGIDPNELQRMQEQIEQAKQGVDPNQFRHIQEQIEQAQNPMLYYRPIRPDLMRDIEAQRQLQDASWIYMDIAQALRPIPSLPQPDVMQALKDATEVLDSLDFQNSYLERLNQTSAAVESRFGPDGLAAAQRVAARRAESPEALRRAEARIKNGQARELLTEAVELATSPEVRETIELADKDTILRLEQEVSEEAPAAEPAYEAEMGTEELTEYPVSKEELLELHDVAIQILFILGVALAAVVVVSNPVAPNFVALVAAINGLTLFLSLSERLIRAWEDEDEQESD